MLEQFVRGALIFAVITYLIGTFKTMTLALGPNGDSTRDQVMVVEAGSRPKIYSAIEGTDIPMPLSKTTPTSSRIVGTSKVYYAVYPSSTVRDTRYRSYWRQGIQEKNMKVKSRSILIACLISTPVYAQQVINSNDSPNNFQNSINNFENSPNNFRNSPINFGALTGCTTTKATGSAMKFRHRQE